MPGVRFELTTPYRRPELKSGALTTRPTWRLFPFSTPTLEDNSNQQVSMKHSYYLNNKLPDLIPSFYFR